MQIEDETDLNNPQKVPIENQPSAETNCILARPEKIEPNQPLPNNNPQSEKVEEIVAKSGENTQRIEEPESNILQIQELSEHDFNSSSQSSKKVEIVEEYKNTNNKDIEKHVKIDLSQIKLTDNDGITKLLIKLPRSLSSNQVQITILDCKERCYNDSHIQFVEEYF